MPKANTGASLVSREIYHLGSKVIPSGIKNDPKTERQNRLETLDGIGFQSNLEKNALLFIFLGS
jgi:hypothetical protein